MKPVSPARACVIGVGAFFVGGILASSLVSHPEPAASTVGPILHTVKTVQVPGPTVTVKAKVPLECFIAGNLLGDILPQLNKVSRIDGHHIDNLEEAGVAIAERDAKKLNKEVSTEYKYQSVLQPAFSSILDLTSSLKIEYKGCREALHQTP